MLPASTFVPKRLNKRNGGSGPDEVAKPATPSAGAALGACKRSFMAARNAQQALARIHDNARRLLLSKPCMRHIDARLRRRLYLTLSAGSATASCSLILALTSRSAVAHRFELAQTVNVNQPAQTLHPNTINCTLYITFPAAGSSWRRQRTWTASWRTPLQ